jgi:hypothetical protein
VRVLGLPAKADGALMLYEWTNDRAFHFVTGMLTMAIILGPAALEYFLGRGRE